MIKQVDIKVGNTVKCIKGKPKSTSLYIRSECEACGAKENIYYSVTDRTGNRIRLLGLGEWYSVNDFELSTVKYSTLPWFRKYYSQCGYWILVGEEWSYRYSSNTHSYSNKMKEIKGGLFIDPHNTEEMK